DQTPNPSYTPPDIHIIGSNFLGGDILSSYFVLRSLVSGDFNGDGFADIAFGNHIVDYQSGEAYIVFGRPRAQLPPVIDVDYTSRMTQPDAVITGDSNEHYATILAVADFDGEGIDDLVANTSWGWGENNVRPSLGETNGWWGKPDLKPKYDTQVDDFDFS